MARLSSELGIPASTLRSELRRIEKKRGSDVPMFALLESEAIAPLLMDKKGLAGIDFMDLRNGGADWNRVVFDPKNIRRTDAAFDPAETASSKLLAGMGANSAGIGGAGGAVGGYIANPVDANQDGMIDDADRPLNAMGGLVTGVVAGAGANRLLGPRRAAPKAGPRR
jgi:hypothetical protein